MKRFLSAVGFCVFLLLGGAFVFLPSTQAEKNLLSNLLNLPAPPPPNPLMINDRSVRRTASLDKNKPPADDAPLDELLAYWQNISQMDAKYTYTPEPTEKSAERLRERIEDDPALLPSLMNALPKTAETTAFVKNYYDREMSEKKFERDWRDAVKRWLTYNSEYFSDDLLPVARQVSDANGYVTNQDELLALARVDWDKARPILDRMINDRSQPVSQTLARWAFYNHAVKEKSGSDIDKYRRELQDTVENKSEKPGNRDLAMDALVEAGDFEGRDDWYFSLLEDETLHDLRVNGASYTGLTTLLNHSPSDKYTAKMLELVKSSNPAVRSAAIRNLSTLLDEKNPEVVEALLPWLENPKWAKEIGSERRQLVAALREFQMPASVPGLIAILNEKQELSDAPRGMSGSANMMSANVMVGNMTVGNMMARGGAPDVDYYPLRDEAVGALAMQKDFRAVPALRQILPQVEAWQRTQVVRALLASRGFSVPEQIEALELIAKGYADKNTEVPSATNANVNYPDGYADLEEKVETINNLMANSRVMTNSQMSIDMNRPFNPSDIKPLLAIQLVNQTDAEDELVTALIERIAYLDPKEPQTAFGLRKIMQNWRGAAVNRLLLKDLKTDKADTDAVVKLLSLRKELREKQSDEVFDVRGGTPTALGIAACLIENDGEYDALLQGENLEARTAMLSCARLIRAALPIQRVAENLKSPNKMLAAAAESYLESEDSPAARQMVLALHPNEALVLGARTYFAGSSSNGTGSEYLGALFASVNDAMPAANYYIYNGYSDELVSTEKKLRKEVKENQELLGVYAYDDNFVRIYKDKAVFSWQEDKARYRERALTQEEFDNIKSYLTAEKVNELPPFLSECEGECESKELLMLGRQGGRRVFSLTAPLPKFFDGLGQMFENLRQPPAKLHYWLEKNISGLDILFEDENLQAEAVWKAGDDFRVLINNETRRKQIDEEIENQDEADENAVEPDYEKIEQTRQTRREQREYENYSWNKFENGRLSGITRQPDGIEFLPRTDGAAVRADSRQWKARAAAFEIRADSEGLYKVTRGQAVKIRDGYFDKPTITANGRWVVVTTYGEETGRQLLRINLQTNRQFTVKFDEQPLVEPIVFVPQLNKFLLFGGGYSEYETEEDADFSQRDGEFFLLDAETGAIQKVKGEARPLAQQTYRPLQSNGTADEFWAAMPDDAKDETQIGIYNAKTMVFKSLIKIPQITFNSMQMWVDAGKIYFVYEGHLLALPSTKDAPAPPIKP